MGSHLGQRTQATLACLLYKSFGKTMEMHIYEFGDKAFYEPHSYFLSTT
jgi:hypothetical protein